MISCCDNCRLPFGSALGSEARARREPQGRRPTADGSTALGSEARARRELAEVCRLSGRRGFTTIEVLTVIGILVILGSLVFIGLEHVAGTARTSQTRTTLANLRNMLAELQQANNLSTVPDRWWWPDDSHADPKAVHVRNGSDGCDFWRIPHRDDDDSAKPVRPLVAPAGMLVVGRGDSHTSDAVRNTGLVMQMLAAVTSNKSAMLQLPTEQNALSLSKWDEKSLLPASDAAHMRYMVGQRVWHIQADEPPRYYVRTKQLEEADASKDEPEVGSEWEKYWGETLSTLVDGWGQPIIYVPAAGLQVAGSPTVVTSVGTNPYDIASWPPPGARPFFASPGPDGDFATTEDNIYSFEN